VRFAPTYINCKQFQVNQSLPLYHLYYTRARAHTRFVPAMIQNEFSCTQPLKTTQAGEIMRHMTGFLSTFCHRYLYVLISKLLVKEKQLLQLNAKSKFVGTCV